MEISDLTIGESVCHRSNPSITWIVEEIHTDENQVSCSTLIKETMEQKKETFNITSIDKKDAGSSPGFAIISGRRKSDNRF